MSEVSVRAERRSGGAGRRKRASPFRDECLPWLLSDSAGVTRRLDEVCDRLGRGEEVLLWVAGAGQERDILAERLAERLAGDFLVVTLSADLLATPQELLQGIPDALDLELDAPLSPASIVDALDWRLESDARRGLVVQVENADELSGEALNALLALAAVREAGAAPRLLLWGEEGFWYRLQYALSGQALKPTRILAQGFDPVDVEHYLERCLREAGWRGDPPFDDATFARLAEEAGGDARQLNRLATEALAEQGGRGAPRGRFPLVHGLVALALVPALAWLLLPAREGAEITIPTITPPTDAVPAVAEPPAAVNRPPVLPREPAEPGEIARERSLPENPPAVSAPRGSAAEREEVTDIASSVAAPVATPAAAQREASTALPDFPAEHYLLQLLGSRSEEAARRFIAGHQSDKTLTYLRTTHEGAPWYVVVLGSYASRAEAEAALRELPAELAQASPWIRPVAGLRAQLVE